MKPVAANSATIEGRVLITELSGSESVIHFKVGNETWVSQSHGIHPVEVGAQARLHVDTDQILYYGPSEELVG
jgi:glycerol transport system ATP-binding protein